MVRSYCDRVGIQPLAESCERFQDSRQRDPARTNVRAGIHIPGGKIKEFFAHAARCVMVRVMTYFDIVFFAIVAVVLILRLRAVLGRRNEDEPRLPNPFGLPGMGKDDDEDFVAGAKPEQPAAAAIEHHHAPLPLPILAPDSLAGGIEQVRRLDPAFDEKKFMSGARAAFTMIVAAFAKGDLAVLRNLLGPDVYAAFAKAVETRQQAEQRLETTILEIRDVDLSRVKLTGDVARLTVRFMSKQNNATYDKDGNLVDGNPHGREEIEDIWTFARNLKQQDPNWLLVETQA